MLSPKEGSWSGTCWYLFKKKGLRIRKPLIEEKFHTHAHKDHVVIRKVFHWKKPYIITYVHTLGQSSQCTAALLGQLMRDGSGMGPGGTGDIGPLWPSVVFFSISCMKMTSASFLTWKSQISQLCFAPSEQFGEGNAFSPTQKRSLGVFRPAASY